MTLIFLPVLALFALLLVAAGGDLCAPWSYYTHIGVILLVGVLFVLYVGSLGARIRSSRRCRWVRSSLCSQESSFLPPVRHYFGM